MRTQAEMTRNAQDEDVWVEAFVKYGGGTRDEGVAAYRRTYGQPASTLIAPESKQASDGPEQAELEPAKLTPPETMQEPDESDALNAAHHEIGAQADIEFDLQELPTVHKAEVIELKIENKPAYSGIFKKSDTPNKVSKIQTRKTIRNEFASDLGIGFVNSTMIFAAMPHKAVQSGTFKRTLGDTTLTIMNDPDIGIPYGRYPRLLLAHICTLAKKTNQKRIVLGKNQSDFIKQIGINSTSTGEKSQLAQVRRSALQLFTSAIRLRTSKESSVHFESLEVASQGSLIWTPHDNKDWSGELLLTDSFFAQCIEHSMPIDINTLYSFRSSVAIDIYIWLCFRMNALRSPLKISWRQLKFQFGTEYTDDAKGIRNFKVKFIAQLKIVLEQYSGANVEAFPEYLELSPSNTHVLRSQILVS